MFFEFANFETPRNFILEQEIPKRPQKKKAKKDGESSPLFFDFFVLKCTYMETYNSHPELYGNIKGHVTILWKRITFDLFFMET